jgi:hypothetical protein
MYQQGKGSGVNPEQPVDNAAVLTIFTGIQQHGAVEGKYFLLHY